MICKNCGAPVDESKNYCFSCGAPVPRRPLVFFLKEFCKALGFLFAYTTIQSICMTVYTVAMVLANPDMITGDFREAYAAVMNGLAPGIHYVLIISAALTILALAIFFRIRGRSLESTIFLRPLAIVGRRPASDAAVFGLVAVTAVSAQMFFQIGFYNIEKFIPATKQFFEIFSSSQVLMFGGNKVVEVIDIAILTPLLEEIIFRGLIHTHLKRALPRWAAALISAFIFGAMHGSVVALVYAFALGLVLAFLYDRFESLLAPIAFHMVFNASTYMPLPESDAVLWLIFGVSVIAAAAAIFFLLKIKTEKEAVMETIGNEE